MSSTGTATASLAEVTALSGAALASERTLPVEQALAPLLGGPDAGLVRGHVVVCRGQASATLALALCVEAVRQGAWLAVVDVPWLGVEAAAELGVPLERLVGVDTEASGSPSAWVDAMGAAIDGFDLVITSIPRVSAASVRRVHQRVTARRTVLLILPPGATVASRDRRSTSSLVADIEIDAVDTEWSGLGDGYGHLAGRRVRAVAMGRRWPRQRSTALWLPAPSGRVEPVDDIGGVVAWRPGVEPAEEDRPA